MAIVKKWYSVLKDKRTNLIIQDGRAHLQLTNKKYDIIISEPSNPWMAGMSTLFTSDFFKIVKKKLNSDGIFCQWIGLYDITTDNLKIASRTFLNTFSKVLVFQAGSDIILIGANHSLAFDYQQLQQRFRNPAINRIMSEAGIDAPGDLFAARYLFAEETLKNFCADATCLNTDDQPVLEFSARHNLGEKTLGEYANKNARALMQSRRGKVYLPVKNFGDNRAEVSMALRQIGARYARAGRKEDAATFMRRAAETN